MRLHAMICEYGQNEAVRKVMFDEEFSNRKCLEHFLKDYHGKMPFFAFVTRFVSRGDMAMFLTTGMDYAPIDAELFRMKAEMSAQSTTDNAEGESLTKEGAI